MTRLFTSLDPHAARLSELRERLRVRVPVREAFETRGVIDLTGLGLDRREYLLSGLLTRAVRMLVGENDVYFNAALNNVAIQDFRDYASNAEAAHERSLLTMWTRDDLLRRDPPLCIEFESAHVFGPVGEALWVARHKTGWGNPQRVAPLPAEADLHPFRISYVLLENNPARVRMTTRFEYKAALGAGSTRLVGEALSNPLYRFEATLSASDRQRIQSCLGLSPDQFWRDVRRGNLDHARCVARPSSLRDRYVRQGRPMLRDIPRATPRAAQADLFGDSNCPLPDTNAP